jgi:hypothetical protein
VFYLLKIKNIEFIKTIYDDSLTQNIFSIANITFSNYAPVNGALLYWQKNMSSEPYTKDGDYKFFYDMANAQYFAAVKFPKDCMMTRDQRQELAYILLEERGSVGTYSFVSTKPKHSFHLKKSLQKIQFPEHFQVEDFNQFKLFSQFDSFDESVFEQLPYDRAFIKQYVEWCRFAVKEHPSKLIPYFNYIPIRYICYANPFLSEQFLIDYLQQIDLFALQYNKTVLARLSASFKRYMIETLQTQNKPIHSDFIDQLDDFIHSDIFYQSYDVTYLPESDELLEMDLQFFEYDRGVYKWPGSEHLIKGIPSFASQKYDRYGDKRLSNTEMDKKFSAYSETQKQLFSANAELHWINRYKKQLDWSYICRYNRHLTEDFLSAHVKHVDFNALGFNTFVELDPQFLTQHFNRFDHRQAVPLLICHLTERFYLQHKDQMIVDLDILYKYMDYIDSNVFERIEKDLID